MNLLLLYFTGGIYVIAGSIGALLFVSRFLMKHRWLRTYHDKEGGKLKATLGNGHVGRQDRAAIDDACDAAEKQGFKRPRVYREEHETRRKKRK